MSFVLKINVYLSAGTSNSDESIELRSHTLSETIDGIATLIMYMFIYSLPLNRCKFYQSITGQY